jgi:thiamine pyrophosphokinase
MPGGGFVLYALVFANGDLNDGPAVRAALDAPEPWLVIAADGGLRHALTLGLVPDLVIGDMDSADPDMLAHAQKRGAAVQRFPVDKDETDLELALIAAAQRDCDPIRVVGAVGDRLDQTIGNVYLLTLPALRGRDVRLVNGKQTAWLAYPGEMMIAGQPGDTLSLIPVEGEAVGVVTENLKYPLRRETLVFGPARGMSNVLLDGKARVTFERGLLLMIQTRGRA